MVKNVFKKLGKKQKNNKGFSLVELIVVIAIMAVLVGVLAPQLMKYVEKSREATDIQNCDSIASSLTAYYSEIVIEGTGITTGASDAAIVDSGLTGAKLKGKNWTSITITYTPSNGSVSYTIAGGDDAYYKVDENDAGKFIKNEG